MLGITIIIATMILGIIGNIAVTKSYSKWSKTQSSVNITGEQMARLMLQSYGVNDVKINVIEGTMTDYFNPADRTLNLSKEVAYGTSVASHAIACHETGHYLQHAQGYIPLKLRSLLVPAANISSTLCWIIIAIAVLFQAANLIWAAILLYCVALMFSIITLPVEFNASKRATAFLKGQQGTILGIQIPAWENQGTKSMLQSAALTYVMATLASILNLIYLILLTRD